MKTIKSSVRAASACLFILLAFSLLFHYYGYQNTWRLCSVPALETHFADTLAITQAAETYARGGDPLTFNPHDPEQMQIIYPALNWQVLNFMGINRSHTTGVALAFIIAFLTGVSLILPNARAATIALVMAAVVSPAALLGAERGNLDLLLFFLVSCSIVAARRVPFLSASFALLGFALKLFPIFGCAVLLRLGKTTFFRYLAILVLALAAYTFLTFSDLVKILANAPVGINGAYGLNVFWMGLESAVPALGVYARILSYLLLALVFGCTISALFRNDGPTEKSGDTPCLDAFRAGAAIYIGTFLLGSNFDYKLIFLIFTIPQLASWAKSSARTLSIISQLTLFGLFLSLYYWVFMIRVAPLLPQGKAIVFILDEMYNWGVFSTLLYLLLWSAPAWVKEVAQKTGPAIGQLASVFTRKTGRSAAPGLRP